MKILADECIPNDDDKIFGYASDKRLVLLTFDRGFGDIFRFDISSSAGVVVMLISQMTKEEMTNILLAFLNSLKGKRLEGQLVIIGKRRIRISSRV